MRTVLELTTSTFLPRFLSNFRSFMTWQRPCSRAAKMRIRRCSKKMSAGWNGQRIAKGQAYCNSFAASFCCLQMNRASILRSVITADRPIPGSVSRRKLDVGLAYNPNNELEDSDQQSCDLSHILIPGELKSNPLEDNYSSTWLDLLKYVREIFSAQARRFVLGFTLCGSIMRLWKFD